MLLNVLKGKIHRARVVQAELDEVGSITVDAELARAAGILEYEKVQVVDIDNGNRFETYVIAGEPGRGMICVNGAAAHCVAPGHKVIIMCYAQMPPEEFADPHNAPREAFVGDDHRHARQRHHHNARQNRRQREKIQLVKREDRDQDVIQDDGHRREDSAADHDKHRAAA